MQYLTAPELAELLNCKPNQFALMAKRLAAMDYPFETPKGGCPRVLRTYHLERLGIPAAPARAPTPWAQTPLGQWQARQREAKRVNAPVLAKVAREDKWQRSADRAKQGRLTSAATVRFHTATRRVLKLQRSPTWADVCAIRAVYLEAQRLTRETGVPHHVDHVIPLQGELVSGLHVHNNLQILTGSENSKKRNRFEVCDG